jgi:hypothetical protein
VEIVTEIWIVIKYKNQSGAWIDNPLLWYTSNRKTYTFRSFLTLDFLTFGKIELSHKFENDCLTSMARHTYDMYLISLSPALSSSMYDVLWHVCIDHSLSVYKRWNLRVHAIHNLHVNSKKQYGELSLVWILIFVRPYTHQKVNIFFLFDYNILHIQEMPNSLNRRNLLSIWSAMGHNFKCQNFHDFGWIIFVFPLHGFF